MRSERILFDESRRVPIDCMHPQKADWMLLGLSAQPPPGVTAWQVKEQQRREQENRIASGNPEVGTNLAAPKSSRPASSKAGTKRGRAVGKGKATTNKRMTLELEEEDDEEDEEEEEEADDEVEEIEPPVVVVVSSAKGVTRKVCYLLVVLTF